MEKVYLELHLFNGNIFYIEDGKQSKLSVEIKENIKDIFLLKESEYKKRISNF